MSESFADLLKEVDSLSMKRGSMIKATVIGIENGYVSVDARLKSEAIIPLSQFEDLEGNVDLEIGNEVNVFLEEVENSFGETRLSREKAKRIEVWRELEEAYKSGDVIQGKVTGRIKGGMSVDIRSVRAFLPGSLVDFKPIKDPAFLENQIVDLKIIKMDEKRNNNIVVSRRAVLESTTDEERQALFSSLQEGQEVKGIVKNLTNYGAFVDLGGIDGLLHITDMSWKRIKHPSELLNVGDEIKLKILKFDASSSRVSLGLKQLTQDPWDALIEKFPEGFVTKGHVTNIADYGCFVELAEGVEGLVHTSEMDWTNKNINPYKKVQIGQETEVMVLEVDKDRRRISLGIKQCRKNPWQEFAEKYNKGDTVSGKIRSITDFGVFIGLDGEIDGLIHLSDLSWVQSGEVALKEYKKGMDVDAVILIVDSSRERISLGIKQLADDPFESFSNKHEKGDLVTGIVAEVSELGAVITIAGYDSIKGYIRVSEISVDHVKDAREQLKAGQEIETKFTGIDRKRNNINLSIRALYDVASAKKSQEDTVTAKKVTLGDLIKDQMKKDES
ncbi:MAG: 30S ribosomal protein S1 [Thiotrichales bacterium]|nr:MAG: 30S ribosomal protein S1 [Thiotrichales bacterium]